MVIANARMAFVGLGFLPDIDNYRVTFFTNRSARDEETSSMSASLQQTLTALEEKGSSLQQALRVAESKLNQVRPFRLLARMGWCLPLCDLYVVLFQSVGLRLAGWVRLCRLG